MSTDDPRSKVTPAVARRVAGAAAIGNFMEWFDFAVYGFFAVTIGKVFFPSDSDTASLLSSLAVYGVAFLVRPIGGLVLGAFADRHGRRAALSLTVVLMGVSTTLVAALPTYASVGFLAPSCSSCCAVRRGSRRAASGPARPPSSSSTHRATAARSGAASSR
jgi:MFS transporter, MHS family, proline/betaine transporter